MQGTKNLQNNDKRWCHLQKGTGAFEAIQATEHSMKLNPSKIKKCEKQTVKPANKVNTSNNLVQTEPKRNIKPPVKLDF